MSNIIDLLAISVPFICISVNTKILPIQLSKIGKLPREHKTASDAYRRKAKQWHLSSGVTTMKQERHQPRGPKLQGEGAMDRR